jgi:hypothetical protein
VEAEFRGADGGALLSSTPALPGQLLAAGWLRDLVVGDGAADRRLSGVQLGGELGDAPAILQQGLQAAAQAGEAQPPGLLFEVALAGIDDREPGP